MVWYFGYVAVATSHTKTLEQLSFLRQPKCHRGLILISYVAWKRNYVYMPKQNQVSESRIVRKRENES